MSDVLARYFCHVIAHFLYLDTTALSQYMTALEGGSITESTTRSMHSGTGARSAGARGVVNLSGERSREDEESQTMADTCSAVRPPTPRHE